MTVTEMINRAYDLAVAAHNGKTDKGGNPYIGHPIRVAANVERIDKDKDIIDAAPAIAVAFLHDVVEDCPVTIGDLRDMFPDEIVDAVDAVSRRKHEGETFFDYIRRCSQNEIARKVKIADIVDNSDLSRVWHDPEMVKEVRGLIRSRYIKALHILDADAVVLTELMFEHDDAAE